MRRRLAILLLALICVLVGMMFAPSNASAVTTREVVFHCGVNASKQVDPILAFGTGVQSAHLHTPAGADAFASDETVAQMEAAATSCLVKSDHSQVWFPAPMKPDGTPATVLGNSMTLTNQGFALDPLNPTPNGLRYIPGNAACKLTSCAGPVIYQCSGTTATAHKIPATCNNGGAGYLETIYAANQCWDNAQLGAGMGDSTPPNIYDTNIVAGSSGACSAGDIPIPGFYWSIHVAADGLGGWLASDANLGSQTSCPGCSGHVDVVFGQQASMMSAVEAQCLDATGWPDGFQVTCLEKPNGDGTSSIWARDPAPPNHVTILVSN